MIEEFPRMIPVRQRFEAPPPLPIAEAIRKEFDSSGIRARIKPGARIAVTVGSRGISNIQNIVSEVLGVLRSSGADPFVIPAMGSHGGATPEGQTAVLAEYGMTERTLGVPIRASMEVKHLGKTPDGVDVYFSAEALKSDGVIVLNRVKPHTDFSGNIGSGILKMLVIGLGKRMGAATAHLAAGRLGYEHVIRTIAGVSLKSAPILCGVAIVENQFHQTSRIAVVPPDDFVRREEELFQESRKLMPSLPFSEIDLLIVDRIGKNISGAGMDPNIVGRSVHGYSSFLGEKQTSPVTVRRIFVRDLTHETNGNAIGIGLADLTTSRLVAAMDKCSTYVNALTALTPNGAKIPIHFDTDREVIAHALASLGSGEVNRWRVVRIADTLSLEELEVSEAFDDQVGIRENLVKLSSAREMKFDDAGNLLPLYEPSG